MKKRYLKPWPLERAELIQKTEQHRRDETARADAAIAAAERSRRYARQEALEALVRRMAEDGKLIEMTFQRAHEELAKSAAKNVAWLSEKINQETRPSDHACLLTGTRPAAQ
jgi:F0F1-type ATP synthase membrane subunit b/b'